MILPLALAALSLPGTPTGAWVPSASAALSAFGPQRGGRGGAPAAAPAPVAPAGASGQSSPTDLSELVQEVGDYIVITVSESGTDSVSLEVLTKLAQEYTNIVFTYPDEATAGQLQGIKLRMIGPKRIPKADFYSFYQIIMFINGYILTKVGPDPLSIVVVQPITQQGNKPSPVRNESVYVTPDELETYASQVATQVVTVLHLPHTDVRQLGNSLRALTSDPTGQQNVTPVGNSNSVILTGFASSVASLARILKLVDEEAARDAAVSPEFDVIPIEFAAAEDMADLIDQLLEASRRNQQGARAAAQAQGATGIIPGGGGETKILTYPRTNSLLVMALPEDMRNIRELVARLDVDVPDPERTYHVYALENVKASELSKVLEDFIQGANRVTGSGGGVGGGTRGGGNAQPAGGPGVGLSSRDSEIVVVADEATNSLLIAASKRRYEEVVELIRKLDRRQDQVLIETALIELTGRDTFDLGVELGGADLPGSGTGSFGITSFGLSTFSDTNDDGIVDQRLPNEDLIGVTGGIIDAGDFSLPVLLNAIKTRRDANVLNIPSVLVNNNFSATVKSTDSQPTQNTTQNTTGSQQGFGGYQDAGVTLQISPVISASGYLRLDISLEVSNFSGSFSGGIPAPKTTRTITTSVNVPDGDTMVVGGIVTDNDVKDNSRVPLLGDIPLLGRLFRRDSNSNQRTTLYFFVTPHILRDKNFADLAEMSYQVKLKAAEQIGADRVNMVDPKFGGSKDGIDLDRFDIPLYRSPQTGEVAPQDVGMDPAKSHEVLKQAKDSQQPPPQAGTEDGASQGTTPPDSPNNGG